MAKTFDREWDLQKSTFLYQRARQTQTWIEYPPMPPPFNLLSIASHIAIAPLKLVKGIGGACAKYARYLTNHLETKQIKTGIVRLPLSWKAAHDAVWLSEFVGAFTRDAEAQQTKTIVEDLTSQNKALVHDLGQFLISDRVACGKEQEARIMGALESQHQQIAELVKAVEALQRRPETLHPVASVVLGAENASAPRVK